MKFTCPHCQRALNIPDSLAGKRAACPSCKREITIPASGAAAAPPVAGAAPPAAAVGFPAAQAPVAVAAPVAIRVMPRSAGVPLIWKILALAGATLMLASFFVPWWGLSGGEPPKASVSDAAEKQDKQAAVEIGLFLFDKLGAKVEAKMEKAMGSTGKKEGSLNLWGWHIGAGIMSFIFSFLILALIIVPMAVPALRRLSWIMSFPAAAMGLVALILAVVFWIASPGDAAPSVGVLSAGVIAGPFVAMGGGLLAAAGGALDGALGLAAFLRK